MTTQDGHGTAVAFTIAGRAQRRRHARHRVRRDGHRRARRHARHAARTTTGTDAGCSFDDTQYRAGHRPGAPTAARASSTCRSAAIAPSPALIAAVGRATAKGVDHRRSPPATTATTDQGRDARSVRRRRRQQRGRAQPGDHRRIGRREQQPDAGRRRDLRLQQSRRHRPRSAILPGRGRRAASARRADDTQVCLWSGTSFSAPQIAGAAALLAQAFPNLTGAQIVQILLTSARDAGAAGTDSDLWPRRARSDQARSSRSARRRTTDRRAGVDRALNGTLSAPMGDAAHRHAGRGDPRRVRPRLRARSRADDQPHRAAAHARPALLTGKTQTTRVRSRAATSVAVTIAPFRGGGAVLTGLDLQPAPTPSNRARSPAASSQRLGSKSSFAIGFAEGGQGLTARLAGQNAPGLPRRARSADQSRLRQPRARSSIAVREQFGALGRDRSRSRTARRWCAATATRSPARRLSLSPRTATTASASTLDRRFGPLGLWVGASRLAESDTLLGAKFSAGLGAPRATSWFLDASARLDAGGGWSIGGALAPGLDDRRRCAFGLDGGGTVAHQRVRRRCRQASACSARPTASACASRSRCASSSGGLDLDLPTGWSYVGTVGVSDYTRQCFNLAPDRPRARRRVRAMAGRCGAATCRVESLLPPRPRQFRGVARRLRHGAALRREVLMPQPLSTAVARLASAAHDPKPARDASARRSLPSPTMTSLFPSSISSPGSTRAATSAPGAHRNRRARGRRQPEAAGYERYWVAEHHGMDGIARSATAVVLAHVGAATSTIRIGAGGIMLPNHAPLVIAEQFGTLESLFPGRIDLGLGRAPGRPARRPAQCAERWRRPDRFPQDVLELQATSPPPARPISATPGAGAEARSVDPGLEPVRGATRRRCWACRSLSPRISRPAQLDQALMIYRERVPALGNARASGMYSRRR